MVQKRTTPPNALLTDVAWDDLRYALFLAREGSVRQASRTLGVSHSTVLRRVSALETRMGVRLFERKADGYEVTAAGLDVFETARELEDVVGALERRVEGRDLRLSGAVRITLPDPLLRPLLEVFAELGRTHPDIAITLGVGTGYVDLARREADIALRIAAEPPPDLVGRRVGGVAMGIYGSARYLEGRSTKDLDALDFVRLEEGSEMYFERWARENVPKARVAVRVSSAWAMLDAVDAGLGVAFMPCFTGDSDPTLRRVRRLREPMQPLWVLTHRDLRATARVRLIRELLADALLRRRDLLEGRGGRSRD